VISIIKDNEDIIANVSLPILENSKAPTSLDPDFEGNSIMEKCQKPRDEASTTVFAVSTSNPHAIIFSNGWEHKTDLALAVLLWKRL
jgi:diaminopimelate epimerase